MTARRRLLRVTHVITDINPGGAELALLRLVEATRGLCSHSVIVLSEWAPLRERFEALDASVLVVGLGRRTTNPVRLLNLAQSIRSSQPDLVQTWLPASDLLGGVITRLTTRAPVVWNLRNSELAPGRSHRLTRFVTNLNGRLSRVVPSKIVAVGERAADVHTALHYDRGRMLVIRNGFVLPDPSDSAHARSRLGLPPDAPIVARLGRYHPDKDHHSLIAAWEQVLQTLPDALLVLAGEDMLDTNAALVAEIRNRRVEANVRLLGRLDDPTLVYQSSDLTISNSLAEGFPNVVGESMAHRTPVVVTDVGDSALLVGDTGRIVPPSDPHQLAAAVVELLELEAEARAGLGRAARQRIADRFSMTTMAEQYVSLWLEVARVRN